MKLILIWSLMAKGVVSQYAPNVFANGPLYTRTHGQAYPAIRQDYSRFDGYAAARYPEQIDTELLVCPLDDTLPCRHLLVVDCAGVADGGLAWMLEGDIWLEVDYKTAAEIWKSPGRGVQARIFRPGSQRMRDLLTINGEISNYRSVKPLPHPSLFLSQTPLYCNETCL